MSGAETAATPETAHAAKDGKGNFRWGKFLWWTMVALAILSSFLAIAFALMKANENNRGVLAAVNDTRGDLEKKIKGVENKTNLLASQSDLNSLTARVAEHEKEDNRIHRAQARAARPAAKDTSGSRANTAQATSLQANPTVAPEQVLNTNSESKSEKVDVTSIVADACGERGIVRSGRFREDGSVIWRCAEEPARIVQEEAPVIKSGAVASASSRRYYGASSSNSSYSWSQAATVGGIGCVVGAVVDHGAGCVRALVGAVAGDFVDQKVVPNDSHVGAIIGGGLGVGASWQHAHPKAAQGMLVGGPVSGAP